MLDLILAFAAGVGAVLVFLHFAPKGPQGAPEIPTTLDGFGQLLTHEILTLGQRLGQLEASLKPSDLLERIEHMISDAMTQAIADLKAAIDAKIAAAAGPAADAASAAKDAEDVAAVQAVTADVTG